MNADTFKHIFLPFHKKLYRIAYGYLENQSDAEDVVQEAYIKLWNKRKDLKDVHNPESYAVIVLKNLCLDFLKKANLDTESLIDYHETPVIALSDQIEAADMMEHVENMLEQLPLQQQKLIRMKLYENLSIEEIESQTGISKGNIKVIISRARKSIREIYAKYE